MAPLPDDSLLSFRTRFPILRTCNYLISNSLGAMPEAVSQSLAEYASLWATRGVRAWEDAWWTLAADLGNLVSPLIGAGPGEIVFQPNVTLSHAVLFSAFDFTGTRNRVVTDAMHFPSILYLLGELRHRGAEVVIVPSDDGITIDTERLREAVDERTAFVTVSHVLFKSAYIHDVAALAEKTRSVGAALLVDGYQSVGTLPVDVTRLGVDAYIGGCLKWLCGGPGAAFLWVRPELRSRWTPRLTGWMAHTQPFDFAPNLERREDAWRFLHGTPNIPAFYAARPGLEIINEAGVPAIRAKSVRQTTRLLELAAGQGFPCRTPKNSQQRGGTVALDLPHGYELSQSLKARNILCDYRPGAGIRLSPHFYSSDEELTAAISALREEVDAEGWQRFVQQRSTVT